MLIASSDIEAGDISLGTVRAFEQAAIARKAQDLREFFEERAGILEHGAGLPRPDAELEAARITATLARNRGCLWASLRSALSGYPLLLSQVPDKAGPIDSLPFGTARVHVREDAKPGPASGSIIITDAEIEAARKGRLLNDRDRARVDRHERGDPMLKAERLELSKLVRQRAKVAKGEADQRASLLRADFEEQLAATYPLDHQAWDSLTEEVVERIKAVNKKIAKRSAELGIPERFCPSICWSWRSRGENSIKDRRMELRMVAQTRITERVKRAKCEIDRRSVDLQTQLAQDGLKPSKLRNFWPRCPALKSYCQRWPLRSWRTTQTNITLCCIALTSRHEETLVATPGED